MPTDNEANELTGWGIYEIARRQDPYPEWARIRSEAPVLDAGDGLFFVTSWELVDRVVRDPDLLAGRGVAKSLDAAARSPIDVAALWLMSLDGREHVRARGLVRRSFSARQVEALGGFVRETADRLVASFIAGLEDGPGDFVREVALALPSEVIRHLFRIDEDTWAKEVHALLRPEAGTSPSSLIADLSRFFREAEPSSGLLRDLRQPDEDGNRLTHDERIANAVLLTTAAIDTTTGLVANAVACLLGHPEVSQALSEDPAYAAAIVEETLRYEPPALSCSRFAPKPFELGGVSIPGESHLLLCIGAANRDPAKYDAPNEFRLGRDLSGLLTFGGGRHFCLGASLARMEAQAVVSALQPHLMGLELSSPIHWRTDNPTVRIPRELRLAKRTRGRN